MRVLMQSRVDLFDKRGGDTVHLEKTKEVLEKKGVEVDVSTKVDPDLIGYDLVHVFNLDWVRDTYLQVKNTSNNGVKVALTPIHHRFSEIQRFEKKARFGMRRFINPLFKSYEQKEYLKNIYRALNDPRKILPTITQFQIGMRNQYEFVLENVDLILPNTKEEEEEIRKEFGVDVESMVVPAGVDLKFKDADPKWFRENFNYLSHSFEGDFVLCVGRIEPRKNQLNVINGLKGTGIPVLFVGSPNRNHPEYVFRFRRQVQKNDNMFHVEHIPYERIGSAFAACKAHVLASWFETTGLVNLEASLAGANVVSTNKGYCGEYLKDFAYYVDPLSVTSIRDGVKKSFHAEFDDGFRDHVEQNFTWDRVGDLTLKAYEHILTEE